MAAKPMADPSSVEQYYNANTRHFLRLGGSGDVAAIHRAIWAPGVNTKAQAFAFLNELIAKELDPYANSQFRLLDLGCGVGGTASYLNRRLGISVTGVSNSTEQVQLAQQRAKSLGLKEYTQFLYADFAHMPDMGVFDAACAIESFVHCQCPSAFFAMAHKQIRATGKLIICDDFLGTTPSRHAEAVRRQFTRGWHINQLISVEELEAITDKEGFDLIHRHTLSPYIRHFPSPLLWTLNLITKLPLPWPYWQNLSGGSALQRCLKNGWTQYHALVLKRR
ncbi:MAG: class I SAM-dependent methyltransferase [Pseudohongiellaceae bacterium]|nr:class I SAM-dependent methyltransferase [Pseudohongiellaceae bacterium]